LTRGGPNPRSQDDGPVEEHSEAVPAAKSPLMAEGGVNQGVDELLDEGDSQSYEAPPATPEET
jgi:hypothetical protein